MSTLHQWLRTMLGLLCCAFLSRAEQLVVTWAQLRPAGVLPSKRCDHSVNAVGNVRNPALFASRFPFEIPHCPGLARCATRRDYSCTVVATIQPTVSLPAALVCAQGGEPGQALRCWFADWQPNDVWVIDPNPAEPARPWSVLPAVREPLPKMIGA